MLCCKLYVYIPLLAYIIIITPTQIQVQISPSASPEIWCVQPKLLLVLKKIIDQEGGHM